MITTELLRQGRLGRAVALRTVCRVLVPHRVEFVDRGGRPPWVAPAHEEEVSRVLHR